MRSTLVFVLLALLTTAGCSHGEKRPEEKIEQKTPVSQNPAPDAGASMETKQVAAESNAPFSTELHFSKRSTKLSAESKGRLAKILKEAKAVGAIDQIEVYAWSDQEYPGKQTKTLPPRALTLAAERGDAVENYFKAADSDLAGKIKIINMASQPSGLKAALNLGDTSDKNEFADAGIKTTDKNNLAAAKRSRAAVMIRLKR